MRQYRFAKEKQPALPERYGRHQDKKTVPHMLRMQMRNRFFARYVQEAASTDGLHFRQARKAIPAGKGCGTEVQDVQFPASV